jgi:hypothetical protein
MRVGNSAAGFFFLTDSYCLGSSSEETCSLDEALLCCSAFSLVAVLMLLNQQNL